MFLRALMLVLSLVIVVLGFVPGCGSGDPIEDTEVDGGIISPMPSNLPLVEWIDFPLDPMGEIRILFDQEITHTNILSQIDLTVTGGVVSQDREEAARINLHLTKFLNGPSAVSIAPSAVWRSWVTYTILVRYKVVARFKGGRVDYYINSHLRNKSFICRLPGQTQQVSCQVGSPVANVRVDSDDVGASALVSCTPSPDSQGVQAARFSVLVKSSEIHGEMGFGSCLWFDQGGEPPVIP